MFFRVTTTLLTIAQLCLPWSSHGETFDKFIHPEEITKRALIDAQVNVAIIKEVPLSKDTKQKLAQSLGNKPYSNKHDSAAAHFLLTQRVSEFEVVDVLRGESAPLAPKKRIFLVASESKITYIHQEDHSSNVHYRSPHFTGDGTHWIAYLLPVKEGDELASPTLAKPFLKELRAHGLFKDDLYQLYMTDGAYKILPPIGSKPSENKKGEFSMDMQSVEDVGYLTSTIAKAKGDWRTVIKAHDHGKMIQSSFGADVLKLLSN